MDWIYLARDVTWWRDLDTQQGKVKQSHNRPDVAQRVPGGLGSQIFMTFGT